MGWPRRHGGSVCGFAACCKLRAVLFTTLGLVPTHRGSVAGQDVSNLVAANMTAPVFFQASGPASVPFAMSSRSLMRAKSSAHTGSFAFHLCDKRRTLVPCHKQETGALQKNNLTGLTAGASWCEDGASPGLCWADYIDLAQKAAFRLPIRRCTALLETFGG